MRIVGMAGALALALAALGGHAQAATITQTIDFVASDFTARNGSPVPRDPITGSFTFTLDNTKSYTDVATGLSFHRLNMGIIRPIVFSYDPSQNWLVVGANAHANQYTWGTNDFSLSVFLDGSKASGGFFGYSFKGTNDSFETYHVALTSPSPSATRNAVLAATPVPASALLLLTGLAAMAGLGWMRERRA